MKQAIIRGKKIQINWGILVVYNPSAGVNCDIMNLPRKNMSCIEAFATYLKAKEKLQRLQQGA